MAQLNIEKKSSNQEIGNMSIVRSNWDFPLEKKNLQFIGYSLIVIVIGYLLMSTGITEEAAVVDGKWNNVWAISVAPIILVFGYCVMLPYAIIHDFKEKGKTK